MIKENNRYERIIDALRNSKPVYDDAEAVSERVIRQIRSEKFTPGLRDLIVEFFFGWVYIGWVRRSMVAAAMVIIIFFGYQQALILNKINESPIYKTRNITPEMTSLPNELSNEMMIYRLTGKTLSEKEIIAYEKEIDQLIKSVNRLQLKHRDLIYLIENDPQLKKYAEEKMNENRKK